MKDLPDILPKTNSRSQREAGPRIQENLQHQSAAFYALKKDNFSFKAILD